jgi:hypothetical protein
MLFVFFLIACAYLLREEREFRVFSTLLMMVPDLKARLTEDSDDELVAIAEKVSHTDVPLNVSHSSSLFERSRKAFQVLGQMTPEA